MVLSTDEVLSTLILVIPGFIAVSVARTGWGTSRKLDAFRLTVWSIFLSGVIDFVFIMVVGLPIPPTETQIVRAVGTPTGLTLYSTITLGLGVGSAFLLRFNIQGILGKLVWTGSDSMMVPTLLWDDVMNAFHERWIMTEMTDGRLIQGFLARYSTWEEPRELFLVNPREVVFDSTGKPQYFPMGEGIMIPEKSVKSLRFQE